MIENKATYCTNVFIVIRRQDAFGPEWFGKRIVIYERNDIAGCRFDTDISRNRKIEIGALNYFYPPSVLVNNFWGTICRRSVYNNNLHIAK